MPDDGDSFLGVKPSQTPPPPDGEMSWLDRQFANTPIIVMILFALCALSFPLSVIGVIGCKHPKARRNALILVVCQLVLFGLYVVYVIVGNSR
jgi:hypothetical protein